MTNVTRLMVLAWCLSSLQMAPASAAQEPSVSPADAAAATVSRYVERYLKALSAVVCEEHQTQQLIKPDGRVSKTRVLVSDLMFVKVGDAWLPQTFRDVISVDGKLVRDRDERLRKLFLDSKKDAVEQARAIARESGRHNLGFPRAGNSPLLPLLLLDSHLSGRFAFALVGPRLLYQERTRPTFLAASTNGRRADLPASGSLIFDAATGAVSAATLTAESPEAPVSTTFSVTYAEEPALKMLVPTGMVEKYHQPRKPKEDRFESTATYSAFRRFQVNVSVVIK